MYHIIPMLALSIFIVVPAQAQTVKRIDLRNGSGISTFYLVFAAREGSPVGHAFVIWGSDDADKQMCVQNAFGLYPQKGKGVFGEVAGEIANESLKGGMSKISDRLIVIVNSWHHSKAESIRREWARRGNYRVAESDCVSFIDAVARAIGLKTPKRSLSTLKPQWYVRELMKLN